MPLSPRRTQVTWQELKMSPTQQLLLPVPRNSRTLLRLVTQVLLRPLLPPRLQQPQAHHPRLRLQLTQTIPIHLAVTENAGQSITI